MPSAHPMATTGALTTPPEDVRQESECHEPRTLNSARERPTRTQAKFKNSILDPSSANSNKIFRIVKIVLTRKNELLKKR